MVENVLADLIRIQSVNPPGGETEIAKYLKRLFDQYKIPNEIIEPSPGRGNFVACLGEGERSIGIGVMGFWASRAVIAASFRRS